MRQILFEKPDGSREHVSAWTWTVDKSSPRYVQVLAEGNIIVYKMVP